MKKFLPFVLLFLFISCFSYKETNHLAIPPIARNELKATIKKEKIIKKEEKSIISNKNIDTKKINERN
jgi:hypothetical protein